MGYKRRLAENCGPYISGAPTYALRVDAVWVGLGILVLVLTLLDVFLTALNYDEAGFFAGRLASWQWAITRSFTRRVARRWRPVVLRQVTGLQVIVTVGAWIGGTILGYGLIYFGSMEDKNFLYSGQHADFFGAIYFSAAQLATVGTSQLTPNTDVLSALSILESLTGVVLVSLTLTFLLGVYDVVSSLRSLSSQFYSAGRVGETLTETANGLAGYSGVLTAIALSVTFLKSSPLSWILAIIATIVTAFVTLFMHQLDVATYTWPYILTTWVFLIIAHYIPAAERT